MRNDSERLLDLAGAAADGARVDWDGEASRSHDPHEREVVRALGFLATVMDVHGTLHGRGGTTPASPAEFERWANLEVRDEIGRGSYGTVYRARDPRLDRTVALKLWPAPPEASEGVVSEGRMLAKVRHPNVVTVHGAEYHDGHFGLWMEHVEGVTLSALLRERGTLGPSEVVSMGIDLCGALAAVHAAGLVHGDVKTQNVMRESGGRLVLMDFSAGRDLARESRDDQPSVSGTPMFMAPEVIDGEPKTVRSDIYALGVLIYHLLTGKYPVEAASVAGLRLAHANQEATPLRDVRPDLPGALVELVNRAIAVDPHDRYESAGNVEQALLGLRTAEVASTSLDQNPSSPLVEQASSSQEGVGVDDLVGRARDARSGDPRRAGWIVGGVVAVALLAVGLFVIRDVDVSPAPVAGPVATDVGSAVLAASVETTLYRAGMTVDQPLGSGERIHPGDRLYLEVRADEPLHLYVLNLDQAGKGYLLFPLPETQAENPLPADATHRLPGDSSWNYDSWEVSSAGGRESFIVVAAREPLGGLESVLANLVPATPAGPQQIDAEVLDALRGIGTLSHSGDAADGSGAQADVAAALKTLTSSPLTREQVFVREIVLDNP